MQPTSLADPRAGGSLRLPPALAGLESSQVDVVGLASVEGGEIARYLLDSGFTRVVGHDLSGSLETLGRSHRLAHAAIGSEEAGARLQRLIAGLHEIRLGDRYLEGVEETALVVATQAWFLHPANLPLRRLRERGIPFYSLVQAYLDLCRGTVIGVTGSHGKSTTSTLLARGLRRVLPRVWLAGNDRHSHQALEEVARDHEGTGSLVLEISNRQLLQMERAPAVAAITNITPNHLEEHGGMEGYVACKRRIFELPGCRVAVRNGDDPVTRGLGPLPPGVRQLVFSSSAQGLGGGDGCFQADGWALVRRGGRELPVLEMGRLRLPGEHNRANLLAALALTAALEEVRDEALALVAEAMADQRPLPHRIQQVWQERGIDFYDDLSSTTPQSTVAAVRALDQAVVLICGGDDKGLPFEPLAELMGGAVRRAVLLPGAGSERLRKAAREAAPGFSFRDVETLEEAVATARELALPGEAVLLSPACPGFFSANYGGGGYRRALRGRPTSPRPRREPG